MQERNSKLHIQSSVQMALIISFGLNHVHEENCKRGGIKLHDVLLTSELNFILQQQDSSKRFES